MTMMDNLPAILALDPGGTTGWCYWEQVIDGIKFEQGQLGNPKHHLELFDFLGDLDTQRIAPEFHIVYESFEFRQTERHRDFIDYIPREYIGVVELFQQMNPHVKLFKQMAGAVIPGPKNAAFFTDDKVKRLGLWVPGRPHAMDATRHYLYHRTFTLKDKSILYQLR